MENLQQPLRQSSVSDDPAVIILIADIILQKHFLWLSMLKSAA